MTRVELRALSELRLREAQVLLAAREWSGAYYLAGYAVECALKACITKQVQEHDFPDKKLALDSHTHDFVQLAKVAMLQPLGDNSDARFARSWTTAKDWKESARYSVWTEEDAVMLMNAIIEPEYGILQWLKQHW